jgi:hypothetical protein
MLYHQNIDFTMFDDMIPWQRDVYIAMLIRQVEEDNEKEKLKQQERRARAAAKRR